MPLRVSRGAIGMLLGISLVACGGSGSSATGPVGGTSPGQPSVKATSSVQAGGHDVCALLTEAEVTAAMGSEAHRQVAPHPAPGYDSCEWKMAAGVTVKVSLLRAPSTLSEFQKKVSTEKAMAVPGIGDAAYFEYVRVGYEGYMYLFKGHRDALVYVVLRFETPREEALARTTELARKVAGRL
ncbi:MAG: hypothetical protein NVSMB17_08470 [Candidatus Dormibacteria bacterium]